MSGLDGGGGGHGGDHAGHGSGFHDVQGFHGGGHGGHGGFATHEALVIAYSHDGRGHVSFTTGGGSHAHAHAFESLHIGLGRQDAHTGLEGDRPIDPNLVRTFVVHVTYHGKCDLQGALAKFANDRDLIRIDLVRANFDTVDLQKTEIADWTALSEPYAHVNMPEGYYPGATGFTSIKRTYWQIGKRPGLFKVPVFDRLAKTFVEITSVTWRYYETADYETKFQVRVHSVPVWDERHLVYGYKRDPFKQHQHVARQLCERIFDYLRSVEPSASARSLRAHIQALYPPNPDGPTDGIAPATPVDEADLDARDLGEIVVTDADARANAGQNGKGSPPPPPADSAGADDLIGLVSHSRLLALSGANVEAVLDHPVADAQPPVATQPQKVSVVVDLDD